MRLFTSGNPVARVTKYMLEVFDIIIKQRENNTNQWNTEVWEDISWKRELPFRICVVQWTSTANALTNDHFCFLRVKERATLQSEWSWVNHMVYGELWSA